MSRLHEYIIIKKRDEYSHSKESSVCQSFLVAFFGSLHVLVDEGKEKSLERRLQDSCIIVEGLHIFEGEL